MKRNGREEILNILFIALLALARMGHAFFWAVPGPTMQSLENNVGENNVSVIFSFRAAGMSHLYESLFMSNKVN